MHFHDHRATHNANIRSPRLEGVPETGDGGELIAEQDAGRHREEDQKGKVPIDGRKLLSNAIHMIHRREIA